MENQTTLKRNSHTPETLMEVSKLYSEICPYTKPFTLEEAKAILAKAKAGYGGKCVVYYITRGVLEGRTLVQYAQEARKHGEFYPYTGIAFKVDSEGNIEPQLRAPSNLKTDIPGFDYTKHGQSFEPKRIPNFTKAGFCDFYMKDYPLSEVWKDLKEIQQKKNG